MCPYLACRLVPDSTLSYLVVVVVGRQTLSASLVRSVVSPLEILVSQGPDDGKLLEQHHPQATMLQPRPSRGFSDG
jgi:hypothetical protein